MKKTNKGKSILAGLMACVLGLTSVMPVSALTYREVMGKLPGNPLIAETRELANGIEYNTWQGRNDRGNPAVFHTLTLDPTHPETGVLAWFGGTLTERKTLSTMMAEARARGLHVVGGVNGDFFHLATGTPLGILVKYGEMLSSEGVNYQAIGFRNDGTAIMGDPDIRYVFSANGKVITSYHFNKDQGDYGPYVFTRAYGTRAGSTQNGVEVIVDVTDTRLKIGGFIEGIVSEVRLDTQGTPIGQNQIVMSARTDKHGFMQLTQLKPGDSVKLEAQDMTGEWLDVREAIGGAFALVRKGEMVPDLSTTNLHPATLIGMTAAGKVVLMEVDGRQPAYSNGISYREAARLMMEMGCVEAMVCDGGGSSTASARLPGNPIARVINRPSDGSERRISNALILFSRTPPSGTISAETGLLSSDKATTLHLYPGKQYLLPGASASWQVKATDAGYHATVVPTGVSWTSTGGMFAASGVMTATGKSGLHTITATAGQAVGSATYIIPEHLTEIRLSHDAIIAAKGDEVELTATGYLEGVAVSGINSSYTWTVDPLVGMVTADGRFTATGDPEATGFLRVSWNQSFKQIPVTIASEPIEIESFETGRIWTAQTTENARGAVRSILDEQALFGDGMLRLYYDFVAKAEKDVGTAGLFAGPAGDPDGQGTPTIAPIVLEGKPSSIGMWVLGDNSKNWLRGILTDANGTQVNLDYTPVYNQATGKGGVDWNGWKHVEATIPSGFTSPYVLTVPLRVMATQEELKKSGFLYVDRIRAIYGARQDDLNPPVVEAVWPASEQAVKSGVLTLTARYSDEEGGSGLAPDRTRLWVDGQEVKQFKQSSENGEMRISKAYTKELPLSGGTHTARLRVEDAFGNKTERSWTFVVDNAYPQVGWNLPDTVSSGEVFDVTVQIRNPNPLKAMGFEFVWNPSLLDPVDMNGNVAGVQMGLEKWVSDAKVTKNEADAAGGVWRFSVSGLDSTISAGERKAVTLRFRAKTTTNGPVTIRSRSAAQTVAGNTFAQPFSLPAAVVQVEPAYTLNVLSTVSGGTTRLTVADRSGTPVAGASIYVEGSGKGPIATTDQNGVADTKAVTTGTAGTRLALRAVRSGLASATIPVVVTAKAEGANPLAVSVSPISRPGGMTVHWLSDASSGAKVQLLEATFYRGSFPAASLSADAVTTMTKLTHPVSGSAIREHKAVFYDLKPGTRYVWRIIDGINGAGETGTFMTPVSSAGDTFTFGFVTDPQAISLQGYGPFQNTLQRMLGFEPDLSFIVLGGDMVDDGGATSQWWSFFNAAGRYLKQVPFLAIPGNHEYKGDASLTQYKSFWGLPATGPAGFGETCYTVLNGDARFYMLDTEANLDTQLEWLKREKAASTAKWNIVVMHRGPYGSFYDESTIRQKATPVFDALGIDLVLSGHDHVWSRTTMKAGQLVLPGKGTTYISGGASGGKFYDAVKRSWTEVVYNGNTPSFTIVKVSPEQLEIQASHAEGTKTVLHDAFIIRK